MVADVSCCFGINCVILTADEAFPFKSRVLRFLVDRKFLHEGAHSARDEIMIQSSGQIMTFENSNHSMRLGIIPDPETGTSEIPSPVSFPNLTFKFQINSISEAYLEYQNKVVPFERDNPTEFKIWKQKKPKESI
jgi:hypothetical protein